MRRLIASQSPPQPWPPRAFQPETEASSERRERDDRRLSEPSPRHRRRRQRAGPARERRVRDQARDRRPGRDARARVRLPARGRAPADRRRARPREDADREDRRRRVRRQFERIQFTPDLVPADLVGTRMYRHRSEKFDIELGPVFCNFLLADEINRAPAKVQSALLEVMQERQVTIGKETLRCRRRSSYGDAEPDRVRGHLPAARGAARPLHAQVRSSTTRARRTSSR